MRSAPCGSGRPARACARTHTYRRDVLVESARSEFEAARHVTDSAEVMQRLLVGRHCLEEAARKFEEKRRSLVGEQGGAPPPSDEPRR